MAEAVLAAALSEKNSQVTLPPGIDVIDFEDVIEYFGVHELELKDVLPSPEAPLADQIAHRNYMRAIVMVPGCYDKWRSDAVASMQAGTTLENQILAPKRGGDMALARMRTCRKHGALQGATIKYFSSSQQSGPEASSWVTNTRLRDRFTAFVEGDGFKCEWKSCFVHIGDEQGYENHEEPIEQKRMCAHITLRSRSEKRTIAAENNEKEGDGTAKKQKAQA
jgi:hypothetical protein